MATLRRSRRSFNSWWHRWKVRRIGKRDGKRNDPRPDSNRPSDYEQGLSDLGEQLLDQIAEDWAHKIERAEGKHRSCVDLFAEAVVDFTRENRDYQKRRTELQRDVLIHISRPAYLALGGAILLGELIFNLQAFRVFREATLFTVLMAASVGISIPVCAHFLGLWIRQLPPPWWLTTLKVIVVFGWTMGCVAGVSIARLRYLAQEGEVGPEQEALGLAFALMNAFVFVTVTVLSYFSHDPDPAFQEFAEDKERFDRLCSKHNKAIAEAGLQVDRLRKERDAQFAAVIAVTRELMHLYRRQNRHARKDGALPTVFESDLQPPAPPSTPDFQTTASEDELREIQGRWLASKGGAVEGRVAGAAGE